MIHPEIAEEALNQIVMAIADLGIHIGETAARTPEPNQASRLQFLGRMANDISRLVDAGEAVIRNTAKSAS